MTNSNPSLLTFPCEFPIKVFGVASDQFEKEIITIIHKHIPALAENAISTRPSKDQKYLAITVTVPVESQEQLDNIYRDITSNPLVLMAL